MSASRLSRTATIAVTLALPFALACGGGETGGEIEEGPEMEPAAQQGMTSAAEPATASLQAMGESGVGGEVAFTREGDQLEVQVMAEGLAAAGDFASHIHDGTCAEPGGVVTPLNAVAAPEAGAGEATTSVDATQLEPGGSYLVMVHGQEGAPVACADVPASVVSGGAM